DHFEIVFRAAILAGYAAEGQLVHVGFATMNGTDGKPFKTREGGVLKLADMQNFRGTSYVFDLDRFTSFEGKTGPYLLYQAVRVKSLLRRAQAEGVQAGPIAIAEPAERELALTLDAFETALTEAYDR